MADKNHTRLWLKLMVSVCCVIIAFCTFSSADDLSVRVQFANEFIRELESAHDIQSRAQKELAAASSPLDKLMAEIGAGTRSILDLRLNIGMLNAIKMSGFCAKLPAGLISIYKQKVSLQQKMIDDAT